MHKTFLNKAKVKKLLTEDRKSKIAVLTKVQKLMPIILESCFVASSDTEPLKKAQTETPEPVRPTDLTQDVIVE